MEKGCKEECVHSKKILYPQAFLCCNRLRYVFSHKNTAKYEKNR